MKSSWRLKFVVLVALCVGVALMHIKTVTFVPFTTQNSAIYDYITQDVVTLEEYYPILKQSIPTLDIVASLNELSKNQIIVLPWDSNPPNLQYIPIKGVPFYESNKGTIQVKWFRKSSEILSIFKPSKYDVFLSQHVRLTAGGTVVLARGVHKVIERNQDSGFPWKDTQHLFQKSDLNVVNFKSPLIDKYSYPKSSWKLIGKSKYVEGLINTNIHLVSVAGNHMGDAKSAGLLETLNTLKENKIDYVGAGRTMKEAYKCVLAKKKNISFGFLAFNNVPGSIGKATKKKPGIAWLDNQALQSIKLCAPKVDHLVVMVNWGTEYTHIPRKKEQRWAQKMIAAGADLILGDQAHWVQNHQKILSKHVSYGLGNYIFDQHWSEKTTEGIIQKFIFFNDKMLAIDTIPIKLARNGSVKEIKKGSERYYEVLRAYYNQPINENQQQNN